MADFKKYLTLLFCLSTIGCQLFGDKGSAVNDDLVEVKGGYSFGFCAGYCKADFTMAESGQSLNLKSHGRTNDPPDLRIEKSLDQSDWNQIKQSINLTSFCAMEDVYGCPDCADGGTEFLTLDCNGKDKTVRFEYGAELPEIKDLLLEIRPLRDSLVSELRSR